VGLIWAVQSVQWAWTGPPGPEKLLDWTGLNRRSSPEAHYGPPISHTGYSTLNKLIRGDVEEVGREAGGGDDQAKTRDQKTPEIPSDVSPKGGEN
jgi:hypothetical protein